MQPSFTEWVISAEHIHQRLNPQAINPEAVGLEAAFLPSAIEAQHRTIRPVFPARFLGFPSVNLDLRLDVTATSSNL